MFFILAAILMIFLLALMMVQLAESKSIEVIPINQGNGYVLIKTQDIKRISHYNVMLHRINITEIRQDIEYVTLSFTNVIHNEKIKLKIRKIDELTNLLSRHTRVKRGALNLGGTILSSLFGVMSEEDKLAIYDNFKKIENNELLIKTASDGQIEINDQFNTEIKELKQTLNINLNELIRVEEFYNKTHEFLEEIREKLMVEDAISKLDLFANAVERILNVIMLSKSGLMDLSLLTHEEIEELNAETLKNLQVDTIFGSNDMIIIMVKYPVYANEECEEINIYPISNNNKSRLVTDFRTIIKCGKEIRDQNDKIIYNECINEIFKDKMENCNFETSAEETKEFNKNGMLIISNAKETKLDHDCNSERISI